MNDRTLYAAFSALFQTFIASTSCFQSVRIESSKQCEYLVTMGFFSKTFLKHQLLLRDIKDSTILLSLCLELTKLWICTPRSFRTGYNQLYEESWNEGDPTHRSAWQWRAESLDTRLDRLLRSMIS